MQMLETASEKVGTVRTVESGVLSGITSGIPHLPPHKKYTRARDLAKYHIAMDGIEALIFDVFGTTVDWRTTVEQELRDLGKKYSIGESLRHRLKLVDQPRSCRKPQRTQTGQSLHRNGEQGT